MTFEPRSMVAQKDAFGYNAGLLRPADGVEPSDHRYKAAMVQHIMARLVREGLRNRSQNLTTFVRSVGDVPGVSADRQRRLLRGETSAAIADLAFWSAEFPAVAKEVIRYLEHWTKVAADATVQR